MQLVPTIGLEIHIELKTKTKMFCGCFNDSSEKHPNINVCPICMGHPGTLPVINKEAIKSVLKMGMVLGGKIASRSQFDRKNYFYPDLPKGYQISQYKYPLVEGGELNGIRVRRIHLEEDAGRLLHQEEESLLNFNRAGIPLMELVTEPDIASGKDARDFAEELQLILRYLDISSGDMEKGEMRCEVNISLNMGTKVEIKNLNSFRAVERVIDYEIERQTEILSAPKGRDLALGGEKRNKIEQEPRGWDEDKGKTFSQRKKEEAHDYRYFPEPDLPVLDMESPELRFELGFPLILPELPAQKRKRFKVEYSLKDEAVNGLIGDKKLSDFFENTISELKAETEKNVLAEIAYNYLVSDLTGLMKSKYLVWDELRVNPHAFGELMAMISKKEISSRVAKDVLKEMVETGKEPNVIVKEGGLEQTSDQGFIETAVQKVIALNPNAVSDYKKGKEEALKFLIGSVMKETKGKTNPAVLKEILEKNL